MDCPQCDEPLATYALGERESFVCENCGYVGIEAEHRGSPRRVESWDDALRRFYEAHGLGEDPTVQVRPSGRDSGDRESWDDALKRFYDRQGGTEPGARADEAAEDDVESAESADGDDEEDDTEGTEAGDDAERDDDVGDADDAERDDDVGDADDAEKGDVVEGGDAGDEDDTDVDVDDAATAGKEG